MSKHAQWREIAGEGDIALKNIQSDMRTWQQNEAAREAIQAWPLTDNREMVDETVYGMVGRAAQEGTLDTFLKDLDPQSEEFDVTLTDELVTTTFMEAALDYLEAMRRGTDFGWQGKRAEVKVLPKQYGLQVDQGVVTPGGSIRHFPHKAEPGETFTGSIREFSSRPDEGGRLVIARFFGPLTLSGLVDTHHLKPRVGIKILGKS